MYIRDLRHLLHGIALATLPLLAVPIEDVPLLSYALTNVSVNTQDNSIAASDTYTGLLTGDPFVSPQQRQRDRFEINDTDWYEVAMEQVAGTSSCRFALHQDWIAQRGYATGAIVNMQLPEQGISGPFRITSIRHILPQKKPEEDPGPDYAWRPVTGLFSHVSDQILEITLDNDETLGVTSAHPVYSTTYDGWRLAGELEIGERVLIWHGEATITSRAWREGAETVYNLEVKELHNFLVGDVGVVVHNSCESFWSKKISYATGSALPIDHIWQGHSWVNRLLSKNAAKTVFGESMTKDKIKGLVNEILKDPKVVWESFSDGRELRALVDGTKYAGFPSTIGHGPKGVGTINTVRVTVIDDAGDLVIKNAFPSNSIKD